MQITKMASHLRGKLTIFKRPFSSLRSLRSLRSSPPWKLWRALTKGYRIYTSGVAMRTRNIYPRPTAGLLYLTIRAIIILFILVHQIVCLLWVNVYFITKASCLNISNDLQISIYQIPCKLKLTLIFNLPAILVNWNNPDFHFSICKLPL